MSVWLRCFVFVFVFFLCRSNYYDPIWILIISNNGFFNYLDYEFLKICAWVQSNTLTVLITVSDNRGFEDHLFTICISPSGETRNTNMNRYLFSIIKHRLKDHFLNEQLGLSPQGAVVFGKVKF